MLKEPPPEAAMLSPRAVISALSVAESVTAPPAVTVEPVMVAVTLFTITSPKAVASTAPTPAAATPTVRATMRESDVAASETLPAVPACTVELLIVAPIVLVIVFPTRTPLIAGPPEPATLTVRAQMFPVRLTGDLARAPFSSAARSAGRT